MKIYSQDIWQTITSQSKLPLYIPQGRRWLSCDLSKRHLLAQWPHIIDMSHYHMYYHAPATIQLKQHRKKNE